MAEGKKLSVGFVNHKGQKCGIYQIGKRIASLLTNVDVTYYEGDSNYSDHDVYIFNYFSLTAPWALNISNQLRHHRKKKTIGFVHDDRHTFSTLDSYFDALLLPTYEVDSPFVKCIGRPIPVQVNPIKSVADYKKSELLVVKSTGFGVSPWKRFVEIPEYAKKLFAIPAVQNIFKTNRIEVQLNIGFAEHGDSAGSKATEIKKTILSKNPDTKITHDFFDEEADLLNYYLAAPNTVAMFVSKGGPFQGPAGSSDIPIGGGLPIIFNKDIMHAHLASGYLGSVIFLGKVEDEEFYLLWPKDSLAKTFADTVKRKILEL